MASILADSSAVSDSSLLRKKFITVYYCSSFHVLLPSVLSDLIGKQREEQKLFKLPVFQDPQEPLSTRSSESMLKQGFFVVLTKLFYVTVQSNMK